MEFPYHILVVADSNFDNVCDKSAEYVKKLNAALTKRVGDNLKLMTVSGRYGLEQYPDTFQVKEADVKNKTNFIFSIENMAKADEFDELLILSIVDGDPYLNGLRTKITECGKTISHYGYTRKQYEQKSC